VAGRWGDEMCVFSESNCSIHTYLEIHFSSKADFTIRRKYLWFLIPLIQINICTCSAAEACILGTPARPLHFDASCSVIITRFFSSPTPQD
jgi:hypothetical protein